MKNSAHGELVEPCVLCASAVNPAFSTFGRGYAALGLYREASGIFCCTKLKTNL
jgi:hypothetical protein